MSMGWRVEQKQALERINNELSCAVNAPGFDNLPYAIRQLLEVGNLAVSSAYVAAYLPNKVGG